MILLAVILSAAILIIRCLGTVRVQFHGYQSMIQFDCRFKQGILGQHDAQKGNVQCYSTPLLSGSHTQIASQFNHLLSRNMFELPLHPPSFLLLLLL